MSLALVKQLCETVGFGLSKFALQKYGGVTDLSKIGFAKLTTVFDKLTDMARGVERLRAASAKLGDGRYAAIFRELNLASDSLDDVPDRDALCALLNRVESAVANGCQHEYCGAKATLRIAGALQPRQREQEQRAEQEQVEDSSKKPLGHTLSSENGTQGFGDRKSTRLNSSHSS